MDSEFQSDLKESLKTIEIRSEGLMHFVSAFRNLTKLPKPNFKVIKVADLIHSVLKLMKDQLQENGIQSRFEIDEPNLRVMADRGLLEQVVINIILNAIQAMESSEVKTLTISCETDSRNRVIINFSDSGPGIEEDVFEKVFIPFFSTKKSGSGIGLSLSRQIMRLHKGNILVKPNEPQGAVFSLRL